MSKLGRAEMERRLEIVGGVLQNQLAKVNELEAVLSSVIKLIEKMPGYVEAAEEIKKINEELLKEKQNESNELSE